MTAVLILTAAEIAGMLLFMFNPFWLKRNLISKTLCSLLFLCVGIAAVLSAENLTDFSWRMLAGLTFGVLGDFFLEGKRTFLLGSICFATGHIFYARAFLHGFGSELDSFAVPIAICYAFIWIGYVIYLNLRKIRRNGSLVQLPLYSLALLFMFTTALFRGGALIVSGYNVLQGIAIILGGTLFVVSDTYLFTSMFSRHKVRHPGRKVLLTYFPAQTLLALSIFFTK